MKNMTGAVVAAMHKPLGTGEYMVVQLLVILTHIGIDLLKHYVLR